MNLRTSLKQNESGLVSLVVTMIIMIVLSLIVVGFAQLARREQRIALDHQLSEQAVYAAESGINDAKRIIYDTTSVNKKYNLAGGFGNKDTCGTDAYLTSNTLSSTSNVSWSCLLIDQSLQDLKYGNIQTENSTVVPINAVIPGTDPEVAAPISRIVISWQIKEKTPSASVGPSSTSFPNLPVATGWGSDRTGILRVDVLDPAIGTPNAFQRNALTQSLFTSFFYPSNSGGTTTYAPNSTTAAQGELRQANCSGAAAPYQCQMTINFPATSSHYYLRLRSIYNPSQVSITAFGVAGSVELKGAQVEIDSTGRAADVLKRIKVRAKAPDNASANLFPEYALDISGGICKLLVVAPGAGNSSDLCPTTPIPDVKP